MQALWGFGAGIVVLAADLPQARLRNWDRPCGQGRRWAAGRFIRTASRRWSGTLILQSGR